MNQFLVIIRGTDPVFADPAVMQAMNVRFAEWVQNVLKGKFVAGSPLDATYGRLVKSKKEVLTDGPFMDTKEMISGYMIIQSDNVDEAVAYTRECPLLDFARLEVREIKPMK